MYRFKNQASINKNSYEYKKGNGRLKYMIYAIGHTMKAAYNSELHMFCTLNSEISYFTLYNILNQFSIYNFVSQSILKKIYNYFGKAIDRVRKLCYIMNVKKMKYDKSFLAWEVKYGNPYSLHR